MRLAVAVSAVVLLLAGCRRASSARELVEDGKKELARQTGVAAALRRAQLAVAAPGAALRLRAGFAFHGDWR